jgi:integrase
LNGNEGGPLKLGTRASVAHDHRKSSGRAKMASVFKRSRWVDASGRKCSMETPGAKRVESRFYTVQVVVDGRTRTIKGYTDKAASLQMGAKLERAKAQGAQCLDDPFKVHRARRLSEHVADWIAELRQLGRDHVYVGLCETRMARLISECGWGSLSAVNAERFMQWRSTATSTVGTARVKGSNVKTMGARTMNHYFETLRTFCRWCIKRKRLASNPVAEVLLVETSGKLRRQRRALTELEIAALLAVVPDRHQLHYRIILNTGLRRDELRQLRWGDVKLGPPLPCIRLRGETTKAKRSDVLPLRADLAELLAKVAAGDDLRVCKTMPSMESHKRYLAKAGIAYEDEQKRRADFHALRHTYGTMLARAGIAPRVAMSLMRHTDMNLTMNVYTDPRVFDLAGAVEKLPGLDGPAKVAAEARTSESVSSSLSLIGYCPALIGTSVGRLESSLTLAGGTDRHPMAPYGNDMILQRAKGVEPSTSGLESPHSAN